MLRLTTTRIILEFICSGSVRVTGRTGRRQLSSAPPCFDKKSHKAADESGHTSDCSCLAGAYHRGCDFAGKNKGFGRDDDSHEHSLLKPLNHRCQTQACGPVLAHSVIIFGP